MDATACVAAGEQGRMGGRVRKVTVDQEIVQVMGSFE